MRNIAQHSLKTDAALVDAITAGDKSAFADLVLRYERLAQTTAIGILRDGHLAQDAVQETFLQVYRRLNTLADRSRLGSWIRTIARRQALNLSEQQRRVRSIPGLAEAQLVSDRCAQLDEDSMVLLDAVNRLPEHEFVPVVLHYFQGHKVDSIGRMTGRSAGTVSKQLTRARNKLKQWLKEEM